MRKFFGGGDSACPPPLSSIKLIWSKITRGHILLGIVGPLGQAQNDRESLHWASTASSDSRRCKTGCKQQAQELSGDKIVSHEIAA